MPDEILKRLREIVGEEAVLDGAAARQRAPVWETHQPFNGKALVRPADTAGVAAVLAACNTAGQPVVPYGGLTNLVRGCATGPEDIALSLERMQGIEEVDAVAHTMTAQAGVTMLAAQEAAAERGLWFPVDIGARAECLLGGNVATNAGGTKVIRYGMMRDSVLGLEAVLADGTVISSMNRYIKNNSGFDLKHLFIGTEGVLGVITRIVLRLAPQPRSHNVALLACDRFEDVVAVLGAARERLAASLTGFEVMWDSFYRAVTQPEGRRPPPVSRDHGYVVLVEAMGANPEADDAQFEAALAGIFEQGLAADGAVAKSESEREAFWAIRGDVEWIVSRALNFDLSLRSADIGPYVEDVTTRVHADLPGARVVAFGHLGDNNVHVSVLADGARGRHTATIEQHVYESLRPYRGGMSAEHGIGLEKRAWLAISRSPEEIALMKALKRLMDPNDILNRGKVFA